MRRKAFLPDWTRLLIILVLIALAGCSKHKEAGEVVAQVANETLTLEELKANFSEAEWKGLSQEQKREYVQQWVNLVLLAREAENLGLADEKAVKNKVDYARRKVLGNAVIAFRLANENVSEEDMFHYYRIHQGEFSKPVPHYKVQRIFLSDPEQATGIRTELQNGMQFEDAAKLFSQESIGLNGGYMGAVSPDGADSTFWNACRNHRLYEVFTLPTQGGIFLMRYYAEEEGSGPSGFEEQKDEIRKRILEERRRQVYDDLIRELKSKADIYLQI